MKKITLIINCRVLLVAVSATPALAANTVISATVFPAVTIPGGTATVHTTQGSSTR